MNEIIKNNVRKRVPFESIEIDVSIMEYTKWLEKYIENVILANRNVVLKISIKDTKKEKRGIRTTRFYIYSFQLQTINLYYACYCGNISHLIMKLLLLSKHGIKSD